ncbi:hypothetical protein GCM10011515_10420 [Tsuneonella deserti]|uniref:Uncharacterized protein n=1 Tax=Tsuneonella deserti TaxID=2035528 RepID=A0ABQ1S6Q5_9SPHN|nr:hypothetical protein GCM10011515_10420 [Tsuneonella deserti]
MMLECGKQSLDDGAGNVGPRRVMNKNLLTRHNCFQPTRDGLLPRLSARDQFNRQACHGRARQLLGTCGYHDDYRRSARRQKRLGGMLYDRFAAPGRKLLGQRLSRPEALSSCDDHGGERGKGAHKPRATDLRRRHQSTMRLPNF